VDPRFLAPFDLVRNAAEDAVLSRLESERTLARLCDAAVACHSILQTAHVQYAGTLPDGGELACRKGCALCCHLLIRVRPMEGVLAATFARTALADEFRAAIRQSALRRPVPCPFLQDEACTVYEVRPRICRDYYSFDLDMCRAGKFCEITEAEMQHRERAFDPVRHRNELHLLLGAAVAEGQEKACTKLGIDNRPTHMHALLRVLFSVSDAVPRWLNGDLSFPAWEAEDEPA
jgi:Fe-S-cluster containining protein